MSKTDSAVSQFKHHQQTLKHSIATIEYMGLLLENEGLYFGVCKVSTALLKLEGAESYFNLATQLSQLLRISQDVEFITAIDTILHKKNRTNEFRPSFEMSTLHVLQSLNDLLRILYARLMLVRDETMSETVLRFTILIG